MIENTARATDASIIICIVRTGLILSASPYDGLKPIASRLAEPMALKARFITEYF
jgi:hypothetical protein